MITPGPVLQWCHHYPLLQVTLPSDPGPITHTAVFLCHLGERVWGSKALHEFVEWGTAPCFHWSPVCFYSACPASWKSSNSKGDYLGKLEPDSGLQGFLNPDPSLCRLMGHFCKPLALCETTMLFRIISFYQVILLEFLFVLLCLNQVTLSSCPSSHTGDHGVLGNDPEHKQQLQKRENPLHLLFLQPR